MECLVSKHTTDLASGTIWLAGMAQSLHQNQALMAIIVVLTLVLHGTGTTTIHGLLVVQTKMQATFARDDM